MASRKCPDFRRAAAQRLSTAVFLFDHGLYLDSMYLSGYAVECALKALLLARTPARQRQERCDEISQGKRGHDFEFLTAQLRRGGEVIPLPIVERLRNVSSWTTDWRYRVGLGAYKEASAFLDAVKAIQEWLEGAYDAGLG